MSFIKCIAYDGNAAFFVDGIKLGLVRSAREYIKTEVYPIRAFGEPEGSSAAAAGKSYEIVIEREEAEDAVNFAIYDEFTLRLKRGNDAVVYGSCRCKSIEIKHTAGEPRVEVITLTATSRKEV